MDDGFFYDESSLNIEEILDPIFRKSDKSDDMKPVKEPLQTFDSEFNIFEEKDSFVLP